MTSIARYGVIAHYPQPNRTEHVNIGIAVFLADSSVRVHFAEDLKKLRAIDPRANLETVRGWEIGIPKMLRGMDYESATATLRSMGHWRLSESLGTFTYLDEDEYLGRVKNALHSLVSTPPRRGQAREEQSRLHLDLKTAFMAKGWMGKDIENHEIVERYPLGPLTTAEFALKNGRLHVIESLDLRTTNASAKRQDVRAKALTLDLARKAHAARYAVLAGATSELAPQARELLSEYSEHIFVWENAADMNGLIELLGKATGRPGLAIPMAD